MPKPTRPATNVPRSGEQFLPAPGATLCAESFGSHADPSILLIGGAAASMDWWEDDLCERLAANGRFVIRYDNRDTGRSSHSPAGAPDYDGTDFVTDALAVLDHFDVRAAHLVGISMGGGIAQHLGVLYPDRVASLTLISTTPDGPLGSDTRELPPPAPHVTALFAEPGPEPDWSDRDAAIDAAVAAERLFAGSVAVDDDQLRRIWTRMYDRTADFAASQTNHWILEGGEPIGARIGEITAPTLVLHGTEDPLLPFPHGEAMARAIPGARLVPLPGVGHSYPPAETWDTVVDAIVTHTSTH